jgi:ornithine decarboxylase
MLPLSLCEGDRIVFGSAGAYTTSYSTVGFNGFAPLPTICRAQAQGDLSR